MKVLQMDKGVINHPSVRCKDSFMDEFKGK
jgi:hypothetical protein